MKEPAATAVEFPSVADAVDAVNISPVFRAIPDKQALADLLANKECRALLANPAFGRIAGNRNFIALVNNPQFHAAMAEPSIAAVVADFPIARAIHRGIAADLIPAMRAGRRGEPVPERFANSAEAQNLLFSTPFKYLAYQPAFAAMVANSTFRSLVGEPDFGQVAANSQAALVAMLGNAQFRKLVAGGEFGRLFSLPGFQHLARNNALDRLTPVIAGKR